MAKNTDQIKRLANRVTLAGVVAELKPMKEGEKDGVKWLSIEGVIQCGNTREYNINFRTFARELNSSGEKSKVYSNAKSWYKKAVSLAQCGGDENKATWVECVGGVVDNMYWSAKYGRVAEGVQYNINIFNDFREYKAEYEIEGYVYSLVDETYKSDPERTTGRQRVTVLSRDSFGNIIKLNLIVPNTKVVSSSEGVDDMVRAFSDHDIEKGKTFKVYSEMIMRETRGSSGGVGVTGGSSAYQEWVVVGFNDIGYDSEENSISPQMAKKMMNERQIKMDGITAETPNGPGSSSSGSSSSSNSKYGVNSGSRNNDDDDEDERPIKKAKKPMNESPYDDDFDDDMPF